ncbi:reverse transcriptase domain-containing protein, partial [Tanacetum coccineum]
MSGTIYFNSILDQISHSHAGAWSWDKIQDEANAYYLIDRIAEARNPTKDGQHPQANGLVERANQSLMEGIKTRLGRERKCWVDELPNVLWAHRTSLKTSNGETPYNLTFRSEAVIPAEVGMLTHRTMMIKDGKDNEEEIRLSLDLLTEKSEAAAIIEA